jgi:hypothetical protein
VSDVLQGGAEGRPPGRGGRVAGALVVALLAGAAVWHVASGSGGGPTPAVAKRSDRPVPAVAPAGSPSPVLPAPVVEVPMAASRPPRSLPWSRFATGAPLSVGVAAGRLVVVAGHTRDLGEGTHVVTMERAADGPVLLVQRPDEVSLEQLRPGGVRLVLDEFREERLLPQGLAVDPTGRFVAYGLTSVVPGSNSLVVRDLVSGSATVRLRTRLPFSVADWARSGVVLEAALDPGGPPYLWSPGPSRPHQVVGFAHGSTGPLLVASAPGRTAWLVTRPQTGCADLVAGSPAVTTRGECAISLSHPAAWSPAGDLVAARGDDGWLRLLDVRHFTITRLRSGLAEVRQVVWSTGHTVLAAVTDRNGRHHAVLRCYLGGECERVPLPKGFGAEDIVLAR